MKKEAQERLMGDVGGKGKYNATPPSDYCPPVERFRFVLENYECENFFALRANSSWNDMMIATDTFYSLFYFLYISIPK